jgi:hypothetical protein
MRAVSLGMDRGCWGGDGTYQIAQRFVRRDSSSDIVNIMNTKMQRGQMTAAYGDRCVKSDCKKKRWLKLSSDLRDWREKKLELIDRSVCLGALAYDGLDPQAANVVITAPDSPTLSPHLAQCRVLQ